MTDKEICNRKFDYLWSVMIQLNARMNKLEGVTDQSALSYENFIALSQAFRKGLEDAD
jgi:hypothetical protein